MGLPKSKRSAMLDPRHRAVLLKEKYRQQMEQRQDTGAENAETQAVSRVESAAEWAADELRERVPQAPKKKPPVKERPSTYDEAGHETESPSERREKTPAERAAQNGTGTEQAVDHRVPTEKQQLEARRQFVVDKQEKKWRAERQAPPSAADPLAVYEADWEPVQKSIQRAQAVLFAEIWRQEQNGKAAQCAQGQTHLFQGGKACTVSRKTFPAGASAKDSADEKNCKDGV